MLDKVCGLPAKMAKGNKMEEMEIAIVKVRLLNSEFHSKIKELNALMLSLKDTLDSGKRVTEQDGKELHTKMKDLSKLKQKYDNFAEAFNISFGSLNSSKAEEVDKAFREAVDEYYDQKVDVERLLRRIKRGPEVANIIIDDSKVTDVIEGKIELPEVEKIDTNEDVKQEEHVKGTAIGNGSIELPEVEKTEYNTDSEEEGHGEKTNETDKEDEESDRLDETMIMLLKRSIIVIIIVVFFYVGAGVLSSYVVGDREMSLVTGKV